MKKVPTLTWTDKQVEIYDLIKSKQYKMGEIAAIAGVNKNYLTKVSKAIKSGQIPPVGMQAQPQQPEEPIFPQEESSESKTETNQGEENPTPQNEENPTPPVKENPTPKNLKTSAAGGTELKMKAGLPGIASAFKLVNVPLVCPITPIMMSARYVAENEWGWRSDMPWENFFDTILYLYCKACGITLQGYIIDEEVETPESGEASPVPAPEELGGNGGNLDIDAVAMKVMEKIIQYSQIQGIQEGS